MLHHYDELVGMGEQLLLVVLKFDLMYHASCFRAKFRDPHLPKFATHVKIRHNHNHPIICADAVNFVTYLTR